MGTKPTAKGCSVVTWTRGELGATVYLREDCSPSESWGGTQFQKEVTSTQGQHCSSQENTCNFQQQEMHTEWSEMGLVVPNWSAIHGVAKPVILCRHQHSFREQFMRESNLSLPPNSAGHFLFHTPMCFLKEEWEGSELWNTDIYLNLLSRDWVKLLVLTEMTR